MMRLIATMAGAAALAGFLLMLGGCPDTNGNAGETAEAQPNPVMADTAAPGIDFRKASVGLTSHTLDYITNHPSGLAGARGGAKIYFSASDEGLSRVYCRDLATRRRTLVAELHSLVQGSLVTSVDGRFIAYSRQRPIERFIDDPLYKFPAEIAIVYRRNVETGEETELFSFREEPYRAFRGDQHTPFISADGSRVYVLAYNVDRLTLAQELSNWLAIEADYRERSAEMEEAERLRTEERLCQLLNAHNVKPELGLDAVTTAGAPTAEERDAIEALYLEVSRPEASLLIWENGETRILPLNIGEDQYYRYHYILAAGQETVMLIAPDQAADPALPHATYLVDLETGELTPSVELNGQPSVIELTPDEQALMLAVNPLDVESREIREQTRLELLPLDGSAPVITDVPGDYIGLANVTSDGALLVGQDIVDQDIYLVDVAAGERTLLLKCMNPLDSLFIADNGKHVVYSEAGILFQLDIPEVPAEDPSWIGPEYGAEAVAAVVDFFRQAGFDVPDELETDWEEREGLSAHEFSVELVNPARPEALGLVRYRADIGHVASVWFPRGYPFEIAEELQGSDMDYYDVEDLVEKMLDRLGWLNPETRTVYQPGPSPIYDGRSDSYWVVFRDGYWIGEGADAVWAINKEASMRVVAGTGEITEMTISEFKEVKTQPRTIPLERAVFNIRNREGQAIPEDAPVRFDTEGYRLVVHQNSLDHWTEEGFELALVDRLCYEIDAFIMPEDALFMTCLVDTETGKVLGQMDFHPSGVR